MKVLYSTWTFSMHKQFLRQWRLLGGLFLPLYMWQDSTGFLRGGNRSWNNGGGARPCTKYLADSNLIYKL